MSPRTSRRAKPPSASSNAGTPAGLHPALLRLVAAVHLDQHGLTGALGHAAVELRRQIEPVHRMNQGEPSHRVAGLVALERADEMPVDRTPASASCFSMASCTRFSPDVRRARQPPRPCTASGPWRLGDRDDPHRMGPAADGLCVATASRTRARLPGRAGKSIALEFTWSLGVLEGTGGRVGHRSGARPRRGRGWAESATASFNRPPHEIQLATAGVGVDQQGRRQAQAWPRRWRWWSRGPPPRARAAPRSGRYRRPGGRWWGRRSARRRGGGGRGRETVVSGSAVPSSKPRPRCTT